MKKKITILICSILIVILVALCVVMIVNDTSEQQLEFSGTVTVE